MSDNLYYLTKSLFSVCHIFNTHNITYWIDWGTALGYLRNNSVIPWDYDIDICVLDNDYEKIINIFKNQNNNFDLICDENYYDDNGCCALYLKELYSPDKRFECLSIDIIKYTIDEKNNKKVKSLMSEKTILQYSNPTQNLELYDHDYDDVFPLRKVVMSGIITYCMNNTSEVTKKYYGESCINNYVVLSEYNEWRHNTINYQKFIGCNFREIKKYDNIASGIVYFNETKAPFIISNPIEFQDITIDIVKENMIKEKNIFAYNNIEDCDYKSGKEYFDEWNSNVLENNMVDAPVSDFSFFPKIMIDYGKGVKNAFCYNLTKSNNFTKYHTDPPYGNAWMYLCTGTKLWYIISKEDSEYLFNNGYKYEDIEKMKFFDIIKILNWYLFGKIYVGFISANDFLYFGDGCFHSVITYEKTIGICGYANI
jgi:phosphorylcholine metabolism protein LicD